MRRLLLVMLLVAAGCGGTAQDDPNILQEAQAQWAQMDDQQKRTLCSVTADEYEQLLIDNGADPGQAAVEYIVHTLECTE